MPELWAHQRRHSKMETDETPREDGRSTTRNAAPEKSAKEECMTLGY
jgi:hypothetical protein